MESHAQALLVLWTTGFFIGFFGAALFRRVLKEVMAMFAEPKAVVYYADDNPWE